MKNLFGNYVDLDLGNDHWLCYSHYGGEIAGASVLHVDKMGRQCNGFVSFEGRAWARAFAPGQVQTWKVEQESPLTLSPSILCRSCGDHGHIRNGKWERA